MLFAHIFMYLLGRITHLHLSPPLSHSPLLGWAAKYVVGGKVLHIARTGNESEIVFRTYLCLLTFIKMAFMA